MRGSIRQRLTLAFIGLAVGPLLIVGVVLAWQGFVTQQQQALNLQREVAQRVSTQVTAFFAELENELRLISQVQGLPKLERARQKGILAEVLSYQDVFDALTLLDSQGQELVRVARLSAVSTELGNRAQADEFIKPQTSGQTYYGPVWFDKTTGEPFITIAVPLVDTRSGLVEAVLVADTRIKKIWDLIANLQLNAGQSVYIVDAQGKVVAHRNPSVVLRGVTFHAPQQDGIQPGLASVDPTLGVDVPSALAINTVHLGEQEFNIIAEQTVDEALALAINTILITAGLIVAALIISVTLGFLLVRQIVNPIQTLATTAQAISAGDLSQVVQVTRQDEVGVLANAFNGMTTQLRELIDSLEQRIADRTQRLEIVASLGERLNAILDPQDLLREVVNQIKQHFGYYHTHIYLFDDNRENLVVAAGVGVVGAEMKRVGHHIPLNAPTSLVAQAARTAQIVKVDNVLEAADWLPNPLLPDTRAEMAAPIMQKGEVIGVLDVQADRVAGLDENDANLLRSLANQVAVAFSNARLFEQTTQSKEEAELAKTKADQAREEAELAQKDIEIANKALEVQIWQTAGQAQLNERMRGEQDLPTLATNVILQLCKYLQSQVGALYVLENDTLRLTGSYAYTRRKNLSGHFKIGEGMVGQAAFEKQAILITNVPDDYIAVTSGLGETPPRHILVAPFVYDGRVAGVIEMGALTEFTSSQMEFLNKATESIAIAFTTTQARARVNELLMETQQQAEELQAQEEELRAANEELEAQTESLRQSETKLRANQSELEASNAELEEKAAALQQQQTLLDRQNQDLRAAQGELEQKATELTLASKYKSEFLANMSHELRTPLNSLLILAGMLVKNEDGNLTQDQVESAQIIYGGGTDLLNLINDILDLSKVEAGKVEFHLTPMPLNSLASTMRTQFAHVAESKGLEFDITLAADAPEAIETDQQRVEQIIKNMLSNAFKFTAQGRVSLNIYRPPAEVNLSKSGLSPAQAIAFSVTDTGIGMTPAQQQIVFEAFQQADGSTSRQYGGTGLGLSISRELAARLGGQIDLFSAEGQGSTFTLYLPSGKPTGLSQPVKVRERQTPVKPAPMRPATLTAPQPETPGLPDDRAALQAGDRVLLVIEDDPKFARVVYDYAHKKGFKCLLAGEGQSGLRLAQTYPINAIILDLKLPGMSGWEVLDTLKNDPDTRHLPVHIMSVADEDLSAYQHGAMGFLTKPISHEDLDCAFQEIEQFIDRKIKNLLLVEDDENLRKSVRKLLEGNDIAISEAGLGQTALEQLAAQHFDCMILDLSLPDMSGFELLNRLNADEKLSKCPVIVYTGKALTEEENQELLKYADSVIVKGVKSPERLLDETALFLHRVIADMPEDKQRTIKQLHNRETVLAGKSILIVDDDARNAFALSKLLADKGLEVRIAVNGQKSLELLDKIPVDLVLMDIMMPGMDGYEVIRRIRAQQKFRTLPVLALTAKAMKGDREKCIEAGASDYLSKPLDADRLFSMLRVWLSRE